MAGLSKENPFKNVFNERVITDLAKRITSHYPQFDKGGFIKNSVKPLESLGFLERSNHIRDMLYKYLPEDYDEAIAILIASLDSEHPSPGETDWNSFIVMPQCAYVSAYGRGHYDTSMQALYEMTKRFTAEGDLRTFLEIDYEKTMAYLHTWCTDENPHVRRLVSEGTRSRLPLSGRIRRFQEDPKPVIDLLDKLKADSSLYVRRSVANNINDIAKDNPDLAIETLKKWSQCDSKDVHWVTKHASRTLIKQGNPRILEVLGYNTNTTAEILSYSIDHGTYKLGDTIHLNLVIQSHAEQTEPIIIDYIMHYVKSNGETKEKVFKLRDMKLKAGETKEISKKHHLKNTSGRTHYPGIHYIELQINGKRTKELAFELEIPTTQS